MAGEGLAQRCFSVLTMAFRCGWHRSQAGQAAVVPCCRTWIQPDTEEAVEHWSQHDSESCLLKKKSTFPHLEIAFENLEMTEKCKSENKRTRISFGQEVTVASV